MFFINYNFIVEIFETTIKSKTRKLYGGTEMTFYIKLARISYYVISYTTCAGAAEVDLKFQTI